MQTLSEPRAEVERETAVDSDGWLYDVATGEVLGRPELPDRFTVDSESSAEWALELRSKIEGDLAAVRARKRALVAQLDALESGILRRFAWWEFRFLPSLVDFARQNLPKKGRTWRCPWGAVAFRTTQGSTEIVDMQAAVDWCRAWRPEAVQRKEWVTVAGVREACQAAFAATGEGDPVGFVKSTGPGESVTVSTGVDIKGGAR